MGQSDDYDDVNKDIVYDRVVNMVMLTRDIVNDRMT